MKAFHQLIAISFLLLAVGCNAESEVAESQIEPTRPQQKKVANQTVDLSSLKRKLSDYGLFAGEMKQLVPAEDVVKYELNTPLFTDYAEKQRLIKIPDGTSATYVSKGPLEFPVGTVIAKTFYYRTNVADGSETETRSIIETRILEHRETGWVGIPYVWNEEQTDAFLSLAGETVDVHRVASDGNALSHEYAVPNFNDCKRCHTGSSTNPIGPKAGNLNRLVNWQVDSASSSSEQNQLVRWSNTGFLSDLPPLEEVPKLVQWDDDSKPVDQRARAYLDVNCAHCHSPTGPARNSGLHLNIEENDPYHLGTFKTPIAAGKGTGGRLYGIVPGKPEESILEYRMRTTKPGEIMPEFGKSLVHQEGLALIQEWIRQMN